MRLYYRVGTRFDGIDPGAVLEDMKVGFSHLSRWERIAVVTNIDWIGLAIRAFAFLIPGDVKIFDLAHETEAKAWISNH